MASYAFFETVDFRADLLVPLFFLAFILFTSEFFTPSLFFLAVPFLVVAFFAPLFFDAAFFDAILRIAFAIIFQKAITTGVPLYRLFKLMSKELNNPKQIAVNNKMQNTWVKALMMGF